MTFFINSSSHQNINDNNQNTNNNLVNSDIYNNDSILINTQNVITKDGKETYQKESDSNKNSEWTYSLCPNFESNNTINVPSNITTDETNSKTSLVLKVGNNNKTLKVNFAVRENDKNDTQIKSIEFIQNEIENYSNLSFYISSNKGITNSFIQPLKNLSKNDNICSYSTKSNDLNLQVQKLSSCKKHKIVFGGFLNKNTFPKNFGLNIGGVANIKQNKFIDVILSLNTDLNYFAGLALSRKNIGGLHIISQGKKDLEIKFKLFLMKVLMLYINIKNFVNIFNIDLSLKLSKFITFCISVKLFEILNINFDFNFNLVLF